MIQGKLLRDAMISAAHTLSNAKQSVDELNIFPVPDGDTGTNMSMTITAAARELARLDNPTVSETADTASSALLRGARGNSGVILSLLFRGFSKGLKGRQEADGADLAAALTLGVEAAYKAVMKPTEGTILTVAREAADKGRQAAEKDPSPETVWAAICDEADASLQRTPELLPVLKKAGVVDAGGQGLCIILRAMLDVFNGGEIVAGDAEEKTASAVKAVSAAGSFDADITFTYCTEYIVARDKGNDRDPLRLRAYLESIGDCVVVVDDDDIIKVHVHTNDPGKALSEAIQYGQFETVKVENMRIQHANAGWVEEAGVEQPAPLPRVEPENEYGFVAVAAGDGLEQPVPRPGLRPGGVRRPDHEPLHRRHSECHPGHPGQGGLCAAQQQEHHSSPPSRRCLWPDRTVHVLPTRTIPQGISAMLSFSGDADVEENLIEMMKAADNVSTGSVTFAARDSEYGGHTIKEGEILALDGGKVVFTDDDVQHAAVKLAKSLINARKLGGKDVSFATIIYGEGVTEEQAEVVRDGIRAKIGDNVDITLVNGGQPVYYYFISIE